MRSTLETAVKEKRCVGRLAVFQAVVKFEFPGALAAVFFAMDVQLKQRVTALSATSFSS
jgi:hypothetical protein